MPSMAESMNLTVAQAVAQATAQAQQAAQQQQQQQHHTPSPAVQAPQTSSASSASSSSSSIDNLTCQWQSCGERCDSAEALYDHVCERHVGRKSTNNLNLTCQWGACRTTTVKRDHITSHIRVHVPLKPHKCDFCGKAFKRPQDLKKHVKTHADDSVLMNSPTNGSTRTSSSVGQHGKSPSGYYGAGHDGSLNSHYSSYQPSLANGASGASFAQSGNGGQYAGYGSVSYPASSALADIQSMDTRRRAIEALNDFLGDIKRRAIDPNSYYDVGHRLQPNALPLPVSSGYNTGYNPSTYNNYNPASLLDSFSSSGMGGGGQGGNSGITSHAYSHPLPNARTKTDLQDIDRFLEQLQATVYETSNAAAAAGVQQPGIHTTFAGDFGMGHPNSSFRSSHSPPHFSPHTLNGVLNHNSNNNTTHHSHSLTSASLTPGLTSSSSGLDTPALTPASVSSYTSSGHSPMSSHSRASFGSSSASGNMYPSLPAVTGMSDLASSFATASAAPASGLAAGFDYESRRYSGGRLQRQAPPSSSPSEDTEMLDADVVNDEDGSHTPKAKPQHDAIAVSVKREGEGEVATPRVDSVLRHDEAVAKISSSSSSSSSSSVSANEERRQENWVENMRIIEALRSWLSQRLLNGEYDEGEGAHAKTAVAAEADGDGDVDMKAVASLAAEKLAVVERANREADAAAAAVVAAKYPSLPSTEE